MSRAAKTDPGQGAARRLSAFERDFGNSTKPEAIADRYRRALEILRKETTGVFTADKGFTASKRGFKEMLLSESHKRQIRRYWNAYAQYTHDPTRAIVRVTENKNLRDPKFLKQAQIASGQRHGVGKFKFVSMPAADVRATVIKSKSGTPLVVSNGLARVFRPFNKHRLLSDDEEEVQAEIERVFRSLINPPETGLYPVYIGMQTGAYFTASGRFGYSVNSPTYGRLDPKHGQEKDWKNPDNWLDDISDSIFAMLRFYKNVDKWMNGLIGYYAPKGPPYVSPSDQQTRARVDRANIKSEQQKELRKSPEAKAARARREQRMREYRAELKAAQEQVRDLRELQRDYELQKRGKRGKARAELQQQIDETQDLIDGIKDQVRKDRDRLGLTRKRRK